MYHLAGGVLLIGERTPSNSSWETTTSVHTLLLQPALLEDTISRPSQIWETIDLEKQKDSVVAVSLATREHDLIDLVTCSVINEASNLASIDIHLIQHSTGQPHPAARKPNLHFDNIHFRPDHLAIMVEVAGDTICFMLNNGFNPDEDVVALVIYDWKTGEPKVASGQKGSILPGTFVLLTPDTIVLPIVPSNSLKICHFAKELAAHPPPPPPGDGSPTPPDVPLLKTACILELPPLQPGVTMEWMRCRCAPNPRGPAPSATRVGSQMPFHSDPDSAVMILHLAMQTPDSETRGYTMVVHRSSLLKLLKSTLERQRIAKAAEAAPSCGSRTPVELFELNTMEDLEDDDTDRARIPCVTPVPGDNDIDGEDDSETEPLTIPWAEWGPTVTRWFRSSVMDSAYVSRTCGQRFVRTGEDNRLVLCDFNLVALRRYVHERKMGGEPVGSRAGESVLEGGKLEYIDGDDNGNEEEGEGDDGGAANNQDSSASKELGTVKRRVKVVLGTTVILDSAIWEGAVISSLPYFETCGGLIDDHSGVMIDEDIIVGVIHSLWFLGNGMDLKKEVVLRQIGGPVCCS